MNTNAVLRMAAAFALGVVAMYYLDPATGRRRRAQVRDRSVAAGRQAGRIARGNARRTAGRLHGVAARVCSRLAHGPVDDDRLRERVIARLGHMVERPGAIAVKVRHGRVVLSGLAPTRDRIDALVRAVRGMPGVDEIDNLLAPEPPPQGMVLTH